MPGYRVTVVKTATIASGDTQSNELELRDHVLAGIITPASLTGSHLSFYVSATKGGTKKVLYDSAGTECKIAVTGDKAYGVSGELADALAGWNFFALTSDATELADRDITVVMK